MSTPERWTRLVTRVLAPNPGPMTLDGTNSFVIGMPGGAVAVVVDPGPLDDAHLDQLANQGAVGLILLTHHHLDHVESAAEFARRTGAPVRAWDAALCIGGEPLQAEESLDVAGVRIDVLHTPGHTADSVSLVLPEDGPVDGPASGSALTGDTILGRGTTIIAQPDGSLAAYLASLEVLRDVGSGVIGLPAHGPVVPDLATTAQRYLEHRRQRLAEVEAALSSAGIPASLDPATVAAVVDAVYPGIDPSIRFAAEASTRAQLEYLAAARA